MDFHYLFRNQSNTINTGDKKNKSGSYTKAGVAYSITETIEPGQ